MGRAPFTREQKQEMCRLYQTGLSRNEVAKLFGCTGTTVSNALKSNGIKARRKQRASQPISRVQGVEKITLKEAKEQGLPFFFEERMCGRGHIDLWITSQNQCTVCKRMNSHEYHWRKDPVHHVLRPGFSLKCKQCGGEFLAKGRPTGFERSWTCSISETYSEEIKNSFCSKKCNAKWYSSQPEILAKLKHRYHSDTEYREKLRARMRARAADPKEKGKRAAYYKIYQEENRKKLTNYKREWMNEKRETDVEFKIKMQLRHRVKESIRHGYKSAPTLELLGGSVEHTKAHLESLWEAGMTWDNWTNDGWHIDHIRPCASFDLTIPDQQRLCFNWRNLQPLWGLENAGTRDVYEPHHEVEWAGRMRELGYDGELFLLFEEGRGGLYGQEAAGEVDT